MQTYGMEVRKLSAFNKFSTWTLNANAMIYWGWKLLKKKERAEEKNRKNSNNALFVYVKYISFFSKMIT